VDGFAFRRGVNMNQWNAEFCWLETAKLSVDNRYQRSKHNTHISRIAKDFDSRVFGAISVGRRRDGGMFVIDGQQRLSAAIRKGLQSGPCVIFDVDSDKEEAHIFAKINKGRKTLTQFDKFRADIHARNEIAIGVREVVLSTKYEIANSSSEWSVKCVDALMSEFRRDKGVFRGVWTLMAKLHAGQSVEGVLVKAMCALERLARKHKTSVLEIPHVAAVERLGVSGLHEAMSSACGMFHDHNTRTRVIGLATRLNKGKRVNRLPSPIDSVEDDVFAETE
jgi:hypothetical protein